MNVNMFLIVVYALHNLLRTLKDAFCENLMSVIIMCLFMTTLGLKKGMSLGKHRAKRFTQVSLHF